MKKTLLGLALSFLFLLHPAIRAGSVPQSGEPCQRMADSGSFLWNDSLSLSLVELHRASLPERTDSVLMADLQQADRSIRQTSAAQDTLGLAWAYTRKGDAEYRRNMYNTAYLLYDSAIHLIQNKITQNSYWPLLSALYLRQGNASYLIGKYVSGVEYLYRLLDSESSLDAAAKMQSYILLGKLFVRLQKNNLALDYLNKAESLKDGIRECDSLPFPFEPENPSCSRKAPGKGRPARSLADKLAYEMNISYSSAYLQKGDISASLARIEAARRTAGIEDIAKVYQNLSIHYLYIGEMEQASSFCLKALELSGNMYEKSVIATNYAVILLEQGMYDSALAVCRRNLAYTNQTDVYHVRSNLYFVMSRIYEAQGLYKEALAYRRKEQEVLDSVYNKESEEKILHLTSSTRTPKFISKQWSDTLMPFHKHSLIDSLLALRQ